MHQDRLNAILGGFRRARVLVVGDYFLDEYLIIDPVAAETSLETGLTAHQVVATRSSPGAAGTVASNLAALGVERVEALGLVGEDGRGYELTRRLQERGIQADRMVRTRKRMTPAYIKAMRRTKSAEVETERLDIKNRTVTPPGLQLELQSRLVSVAPDFDAVVALDQVQEEDCGVISVLLRHTLASLAQQNPQKIFLADSRSRIGAFRQVCIKPNLREAAAAAGLDVDDRDEILVRLFARTGRPVFLTRGRQGIDVFDGGRTWSLPALPCSGPVDPVGAGDSASAAIVAALCSGASPAEAAEIGNLAAGVTVRKIGTTGTASIPEIRDLWVAQQSLGD